MLCQIFNLVYFDKFGVFYWDNLVLPILWHEKSVFISIKVKCWKCVMLVLKYRYYIGFGNETFGRIPSPSRSLPFQPLQLYAVLPTEHFFWNNWGFGALLIGTDGYRQKGVHTAIHAAFPSCPPRKWGNHGSTGWSVLVVKSLWIYGKTKTKRGFGLGLCPCLIPNITCCLMRHLAHPCASCYILDCFAKTTTYSKCNTWRWRQSAQPSCTLEIVQRWLVTQDLWFILQWVM